jgi:hypothetical protein
VNIACTFCFLTLNSREIFVEFVEKQCIFGKITHDTMNDISNANY